MPKRRSREDWLGICKEFEASGETVLVFARRRRLHRGTLYAWRRRFREEGPLASSAPTVVEVVRDSFDAASGIVVRFGGVAIEFGRGVPPTGWIAELAERC